MADPSDAHEPSSGGEPGVATPPAPVRQAATLALSIGALGVVFGDIGTNPLFAMREAFVARHHVALTDANVIGLLSLMFWSLIIVVAVKYISVVMRADNDGEGGILALAALIIREGAAHKRTAVLALVAVFGAALLYGDGMVTPAISVLAAVEGTVLVAPSLERFVDPAAIVILIVLFAVQRRGTTTIGRVFGPVMMIWFVTIGVLGAVNLAQEPAVLRAVWPGHAVSFFSRNGFTGFLVLGAVILVVVGGEALYADMGHFGRRAITRSWYGVVLPALVLVYFGQGALLVRDPAAIENPFYRMAPHWALFPLIVLATLATVIASQALISGAFSLTHQAVQLGYLPRVLVRHTSEHHAGQIYIPSVNTALMVACIGLVVGFRHSENLAAAYGVAVSTTMVMTTILFAVVAVRHFHWKRPKAWVICGVFLVVDLAFFSATLFKIRDGGWFPLAVGLVIFTLMTTWRTGRKLVRSHLVAGGEELPVFVTSVLAAEPVRAPGASCYLYSTAGMAPPSLAAELRHNDALHETVLVLTVVTSPRPRVDDADRVEVIDLGGGFHQVTVTFGFVEEPLLVPVLERLVFPPLGIDAQDVSYVLGRESVKVTPAKGMAQWREQLYALMQRNATNAADHFGLPIDQTVEIGMGVAI